MKMVEGRSGEEKICLTKQRLMDRIYQLVLQV
jgi:hypothetical protein